MLLSVARERVSVASGFLPGLVVKTAFTFVTDAAAVAALGPIVRQRFGQIDHLGRGERLQFLE